MVDRKPAAREPDEPKPGPDPERLKIEGEWEESMGKALKKKKPPEGWPKPEKDKGREND